MYTFCLFFVPFNLWLTKTRAKQTVLESEGHAAKAKHLQVITLKVLYCISFDFPPLSIYAPPRQYVLSIFIKYENEKVAVYDHLYYFQGPSSQWVDVMKMKRAVHEKIIDKVNQQHASNHSAQVNL